MAMAGVTPSDLRRVVRRKKTLLVRTLKLTNEELDQLEDRGLLPIHLIEYLKKLKEDERVSSVIDSLSLDVEGGTDKLLSLIKSQSVWLHEELMTEARAESGNLCLDEDELEDASLLVHRYFGTSKRFSEQDKKTMTSLVATKAQVAKEVWSNRLDSTKTELNVLKKEIAEREKLIKATNETLKMFNKQNEIGLNDFRHDMRSTSQVLTSSHERVAEDAVDELLRRTEFLLERFGRILLDRSRLAKQRQQCMDILKCDDHRMPLHQLIQDTIDQLVAESRTSKEHLGRLKTKAATLEEQLISRDVQLEQLRHEVEHLRASNSPQSSTEEEDINIKCDNIKDGEMAIPNEPSAMTKDTKRSKSKMTVPVMKSRHCMMRPEAKAGKSKRCLLDI